MNTSVIEGEMLDRLSVQSSPRRQLGLFPDSCPAKPREQGIAEMTVDVCSTCAESPSFHHIDLASVQRNGDCRNQQDAKGHLTP